MLVQIPEKAVSIILWPSLSVTNQILVLAGMVTTTTTTMMMMMMIVPNGDGLRARDGESAAEIALDQRRAEEEG